tara:strand:+ start:1373 stop:1951 length:579 start_codon:yes stop_codon:yes gene_type:complete
MKRVFVGVSLPEGVVESMLALQTGLRGVRLIKSENIHLTLRFVGQIHQPQLRILDSLLSNLEFEEFLIQLEGVGVFPFKGYPKTIWVGLSINQALKKLQALIEAKCRSAGVKAESRKYYPHVTLGRVKFPRQNEINNWLQRHQTFKTKAFLLNRFILFQSILNPGGSVYTAINDYYLAVNHELHEFNMKESL